MRDFPGAAVHPAVGASPAGGYHPFVPTIPLMRPQLPSAQELLPFLQRIDAHRWYTNFGPLHDEFLEALRTEQAALEGVAVQACLVSSATAGLELALSAMDLPPGARVAVPALSFPATATAVQRCGLVPVVADVDNHTWMLQPQGLTPEWAHAARLAAVLPVATFGMPQDAQAWAQWSQASGLPVLIDAAAAWGAQRTAPGVDAVFSLHATKALSCGEGGVVMSRSAERMERLRRMSNFGIGQAGATLAGNAKLSEYHSAVGLAHLLQWPHQRARRWQVWRRYRQVLAGGVGLGLTPDLLWQADTGWVAPSVLCVRLRDAAQRQACEAALEAAGIQTRRWYQPLLHQQPMLGPLEVIQALPHAQALSEQLLGLPFFLDLSAREIDTVVSVLQRACSAHTGEP